MLSALAKFDQFKIQLAEDFAFKQKDPIKAMTQINKVQDPKLKAQLMENIGPLADQKYAEIAEQYLQQNSPVNAWKPSNVSPSIHSLKKNSCNASSCL